MHDTVRLFVFLSIEKGQILVACILVRGQIYYIGGQIFYSEGSKLLHKGSKLLHRGSKIMLVS
jgi:hypothetical protein